MTQHGLRTSVSENIPLVSEKNARIGGTITAQNVAQGNRRAIKVVEIKRNSDSTPAPLLRAVSEEMGYRWLMRGTVIRNLAKNFKVTTARAEAAVREDVRRRLAMRAAAFFIAIVGIAQAATTQDASVAADSSAMWLMPIGLMLAAVRFAGTRKAVR